MFVVANWLHVLWRAKTCRTVDRDVGFCLASRDKQEVAFRAKLILKARSRDVPDNTVSPLAQLPRSSGACLQKHVYHSTGTDLTYFFHREHVRMRNLRCGAVLHIHRCWKKSSPTYLIRLSLGLPRTIAVERDG